MDGVVRSVSAESMPNIWNCADFIAENDAAGVPGLDVDAVDALNLEARDNPATGVGDRFCGSRLGQRIEDARPGVASGDLAYSIGQIVIESFGQFGLNIIAHAYGQILLSIITPERLVHGTSRACAKFSPADKSVEPSA